MTKRFWRDLMLVLPMMVIAFCSQANAASYATLTISSTGTPVSGPGSTIIAFGDSAGHLYSETVPYGQYSTPASLAAWLGAKFSSSYLCPGVGNCLSGLGARASGSAVTLQLNNGASFGQLSITNLSASFSFNLSALTQSTSILSWPTPAAITAGTALSGTQLNATASVPGVFTYFPGPGTVLDAGTQTLSVTFAPTDFVDYTTATASVSLVVNPDQSGQNTPTISWSTPTAISYGTALSSTQLNASASYNGTAVSGTFEYTPAAGEVLDAGSQALLVAFFPTDSVHYTSAGGSVLLQVNSSTNPVAIYSYSIPEPSGSNCTSSGFGYDCIGNLKNFSDSVTGTWNFAYDSLNRLVGAQNTAVTPTSTQYATDYGCWTYDSFGNRTLEAYSTAAASTTPCAAGANDNVLYISTPTNSTLNNNQLASSLASYDLSGNLQVDLTKGNTFLYDGEGRVCAVRSEPVSGTYTMTAYVYDAEGNRVAKGTLSSWPSNGLCPNLAPAAGVFTPTNSYVLGLSNEQLTETDGNGNWIHTNVYAAGMQIATYDLAPTGNPALHFQLADWLGSRRVQTNQNGVVEESFVSLPFGDGLTPIPNPNCLPANGCYSEDSTEHHFTGKERDPQTEGGNDYFGARYYASSMGRFMSPDWSAKYEPIPYAKLDNPQTLNLYAYVGNNPLNRTDPTGHYEIGCGSGVKDCDKQMKNTNDSIAKGLKSKDPKVVAAAKAYGKLGEKNGVNVSIVKVVDVAHPNVAGNTGGSLQPATDGVNTVMQNTQVNIRAGMSSDDLSDTVIHEGSHVEDHANYAAAVNALQDPTGQLAKAMNVTGRQSENSAYGVENANRAQRGASQIDIQNQLSNPPYSTNPHIDEGIFSGLPY